MRLIDGSEGEGGGQILRTSLALSAVTGEPVTLERIRARRAKPGLRNQHLTAVDAVAQVCGATVEGAALGSQRIVFRPGRPRAGTYRFSIGTAGSTGLVLQAVLPVLLAARGPSAVALEGGTHNMMAPPYDFLEHVFFAALRRMGVSVSAVLERPGFYPAGGGRFRVEVAPPGHLTPLELLERGAPRARWARALVARLPRHIGERELAVVGDSLGWPEKDLTLEERDDAPGPGNALLLGVDFDGGRELVTGFGRRGVPAEQVAAEAVAELREYLAGDVPVGRHLADQLLVPLALAGRGAFRTLPLTLHALTNMTVIEKLLPVRFGVTEEAGGAVRVEVHERGSAD
jgi:RNA 3'-terminal phosphate cyclase (ATP)